ncbi:hypothetical protein E4T56_gene18290 [Termitomyces sp. T112]|nr:hypothetical protein E4T56_gene18290 [Termitomyces sp. T112]
MLRFARCVQRCTLLPPFRHLARGIATEPKPYYITTPIFYPNADPHIGHLYSLVIADVFARYRRILEPNRPVKFLAGTDEHGLKIQKAAQAQGLPPAEFCDKLRSRFQRLAEKAQISHTVFMRTTLPEHRNTVESVWDALLDKGLIYTATYSGWYSITDECFYTDTQVMKDGVKGMISRETGSVVEQHTEPNYMFRLSAFNESLLAHYRSSDHIFPPQQNAFILQTLEQKPLEDLSVSRPSSRLSWGIPVPGDPEQTIYVWFEALLVYLSGIGHPWNGNKGLEAGWPVDLQIIGKDILRFHAFYLPAILQALGMPLQDQLLTHAHWTVDQQKMSKSVGNVADPFEAIEKFGVDVVRFYLLRVGGRFRDDTDWSRTQLEKHDREIQSRLGNLLMRITSTKIAERANTAPHLTISSIRAELRNESPILALLDATKSMPSKVHLLMEQLELGDALNEIMEVLRLANKAINDVAPWDTNTAPADVFACRGASLEALRVVGICLQPFVPGVAGRLLDALNVSPEKRTWAAVEEKALLRQWAQPAPGAEIKKAGRLFQQ